jgi:hypothetical protein
MDCDPDNGLNFHIIYIYPLLGDYGINDDCQNFQIRKTNSFPSYRLEGSVCILFGWDNLL